MAQKRVDLRDAMLFVMTSVDGPTGYYDTKSPPTVIWGCVQFGEGNFTATLNDAPEYMGDRGKLDDVRFGDEAPMDVSFEGKFTGLRLPPYPINDPLMTYSLAELITGKLMDVSTYGTRLAGLPEPWLVAEPGGATLTACIPYCTWLEVHLNPKLSCPDLTIEGEAQLYQYFRAPSINIDFDAGQISVTGNAHILVPQAQRVEFTYTNIADAAPLDPAEWAYDPRDSNFV